MVGSVAPWFERPQLSRETGEISKVKKLQVEEAEYWQRRQRALGDTHVLLSVAALILIQENKAAVVAT